MSIFPTKMLLATDGSEQPKPAATTSATLAGGTDSELHVVTVGSSLPAVFAATEGEPARMAREARRTLDEQVRLIEAALRGAGSRRPTSGWEGRRRRSEALAEDVGAGLIAMGSRGRGGIRRALMGSVSGRVVRHAHWPVLVARG